MRKPLPEAFKKFCRLLPSIHEQRPRSVIQLITRDSVFHTLPFHAADIVKWSPAKTVDFHVTRYLHSLTPDERVKVGLPAALTQARYNFTATGASRVPSGVMDIHTAMEPHLTALKVSTNAALLATHVALYDRLVMSDSYRTSNYDHEYYTGTPMASAGLPMIVRTSVVHTFSKNVWTAAFIMLMKKQPVLCERFMDAGSLVVNSNVTLQLIEGRLWYIRRLHPISSIELTHVLGCRTKSWHCE